MTHRVGSVAPSLLSKSNSDLLWILDSGATDHMVCSPNALIKSFAVHGRTVQLPDGSQATITHIGSVEFSNIVLDNVLCVPAFHFNLISVRKLCKSLHCLITFSSDICLIQDLRSRKMIGIGTERDGLYQFTTCCKGAPRCCSNRWEMLSFEMEDTLNALKEKSSESEALEPEPEPTTEVLFLCSYERCGKTFVDAGALRKHSHIHGERQYVCNYEGCGKKFVDRSKLKRDFLIHTGARDFVCPHEGCGKAFFLDFNLRSHMKTHSQENYHNHISSHHEKSTIVEVVKYAPPSGKISKGPRPPAAMYGSVSSDHPYACP